MATVTKSKGKGSKKTKKSSTEEIMDPIDPVDPVAAIVAEKDDIIAQLNEKIRSMTIEIETLRKSVPKKHISSVIQVGSPTIRTPAKPRKNTLLSSSSVSTPSRLQNIELNVSDRSIKTKGCSCKGLCKTKICGCVKKNQPCTENCKCTEACENISDEVFNENNKENVDKNQINNNVKIEHQDDDDYTENFEANVSTKKSLDNASTTSGSYGSNLSESHQSNEEEEEEEEEEEDDDDEQQQQHHQNDDFNPMKPTKTLPRSPLVGKSESMMNQSSPGTDVDENKLVPQVNTSNTDTAIIVKAKGNKSDDEGLITTVDWEKHQNQLKPCSKCHRRFFPDRLPIHENACLKI